MPVRPHHQRRARAHLDGGPSAGGWIGDDVEDVAAAKQVGERAVDGDHHVALAEVQVPVLADPEVEPQIAGQASAAERPIGLRGAAELAALVYQVAGLPLEISRYTGRAASIGTGERQFYGGGRGWEHGSAQLKAPAVGVGRLITRIAIPESHSLPADVGEQAEAAAPQYGVERDSRCRSGAGAEAAGGKRLACRGGNQEQSGRAAEIPLGADPESRARTIVERQNAAVVSGDRHLAVTGSHIKLGREDVPDHRLAVPQ